MDHKSKWKQLNYKTSKNSRKSLWSWVGQRNPRCETKIIIINEVIKWTLLKINDLCTSTDTVQGLKRQTTDLGIFSSHMSDKEFVPRMHN